MEPEGSNPSQVSILSQMNPLHILKLCFCEIIFKLSYRLLQVLTSGLDSSGFPTKFV